MGNLQPQPGDRLSLFDEDFRFREHPQAAWTAYCAEGKRAAVFQLEDASGGLWALKVFKPLYCEPSLMEQATLAERTKGLQGLRGSRRRVVPPSAPSARSLPELKYAILMPWIGGDTWADLLLRASMNSASPSPRELEGACYHFTRVLAQMEAVGIAHTDLSPGNLVVDLRAREVELIDLEDMYMPNRPAPRFENIGVPGYRPASVDAGESLWSRLADRYAGAILATEMLLLGKAGAAARFTGESLFTGPAGTEDNDARFREASLALATDYPRFTGLLARTWTARNLEGCPRLRELSAALEEDCPALRPAPPRRHSPPSVAVAATQTSARPWRRWGLAAAALLIAIVAAILALRAR